MPLRCRLCGQEDLRPKGTVDGFDFVECRACEFVFAPALTRERMERLYRAGYHGPDDGAPSGGWADTTFLVPALERTGEGPLEILDFGTGQSRVPAQLRSVGHNVVAVDVAAPADPHPDRLTGDLLDLELDADRFDIAFAFQVFEHLPEPRPFVIELLRVTRPGGLVLVHTDMETPERDAGLEQWWYVDPPDHCAFYRHRSFETLLGGTNHRIEFREPKAVLIRVGEA